MNLFILLIFNSFFRKGSIKRYTFQSGIVVRVVLHIVYVCRIKKKLDFVESSYEPGRGEGIHIDFVTLKPH